MVRSHPQWISRAGGVAKSGEIGDLRALLTAVQLQTNRDPQNIRNIPE